jgi:hypothetical protein
MPESKDRSLLLRMPKENSSLKRGVNHLFVVGINAYQQLAKLENAVRDAQAFRDVLLERYRFEADHVYELYDAEAKRRNIMTSLREMIDRLKAEDSLIIYFSGHGHYDEKLEQGYWVPVDATYQFVDDYISYAFLMDIAKAIPARHLLFVIDSCYSGAILVRERNNAKARLERDPSRWIIASGRNEVVKDGVKGGNSPFATELLDLLRNYDDQAMTTQMLIARLVENVTYNATQTPIGQALFGVGHKGGQFIFYPKKGELPPLKGVSTNQGLEKTTAPPKPATGPEPPEWEGLRQQEQILIRKLAFMRKQLAITADPATKFALEEQVQEIEAEIAAIRKKMGK